MTLSVATYARGNLHGSIGAPAGSTGGGLH